MIEIPTLSVDDSRFVWHVVETNESRLSALLPTDDDTGLVVRHPDDTEVPAEFSFQDTRFGKNRAEIRVSGERFYFGLGYHSPTEKGANNWKKPYVYSQAAALI